MPSSAITASQEPATERVQGRPGMGLYRTNAVWDLTSIPGETQLRVTINLEFSPSTTTTAPSENVSPVRMSHETSNLDRVSMLKKFVSGLIPRPEIPSLPVKTSSRGSTIEDWFASEVRSDIQLYKGDRLLDEHDYLFEYGLQDNDTVRVVYRTSEPQVLVGQ